MTRPSLTLILPLCLALAVACKGDSVGPERVLTTLEVSATSAALFPEYTSQLTISAWDQFGVPLLERFDGEWAHMATYTSSAPEIVKVSSGGLMRAVAPGTAEITTTLTLDGVTRTASVTATVLSGPQENATVTANQNGSWSPTTVAVKAGGTVTWVVPDGVQIGTIWLNEWDTNAEKLEFIDGRATRTFSVPGIFYYGDRGAWDESGGSVHVYVGPERVLTTLEVSATSTALFPEYTSQLTIKAWDQFGAPIQRLARLRRGAPMAVIAVPRPGSCLARELSSGVPSAGHFRIDRGEVLV